MRSCHLQTDSFSSSFLIWMSFISCVIALARAYRTVLKRGSESIRSCLFHGLRIKAFNISPLSYDVGCRFVIYGFYCVEIPSIPNLLSPFFFYHERILHFIDCFLSIYWNDHMIIFSLFILLNVMYHICVC